MLEAEIAQRLEAGVEVGPSQLVLEEARGRGGAGLDGRVRWVWGGHEVWFEAEFARAASPQVLREVTGRLLYHRESRGGAAQVLLVAPWLGEEQLRRCMEVGVSAADLCGNGVLFDGEGRWLWRSGQPNPFKTTRPILKVFAGGSSLVGRALLVEPWHASVGALREAIVGRGGEIALSTVSRVLKVLVEELIVGRDREGIALLQPAKLLAALQQAWAPQGGGALIRGRWGGSQEELLERLRPFEDEVAWSFLGGFHPEVRVAWHPAHVLRVRSEAALDALALDRRSRFPDVEVRVEPDPLPWFDRRLHAGTPFLSPLQLYLDASLGDARQHEAAALLKERLLSAVEAHAEGAP